MKNPIVLLLFLLANAASAQTLAELKVIERSSGQTLAVYWHEGRAYVAGEPNREYRIEVQNLSGEDALAVVSVDGVNVVSGETASPQQTGYVIDAGGRQRIDGWRKSLNETAAFYFTSISDSYAARSGRAGNVGVIGAAIFRRKVVYFEPRLESELSRDAQTGAAPSARSSQSMDRPSESLGTGHGRRERSDAQYVGFERATSAPEQRLSIWYDSYANLLARGIIPQTKRPVADAFPGTFVPDPP